MTSTLLLFTILACEIAFWLFLVGGLTCRYVFKLNRISSFLLYSIPIIDLILLVATVVDLRAGSVATFAHGLAAAYLGFTIAFGRVTIDWADGAFARRFAGGAAAAKPPSHGLELLLFELKWFGRCLIAVAVTIILTYLAIVLVNDPLKTEAFEIWMQLPLVTAGLWFLFGPLWSLVFCWSSKPGNA
ncbi:MAG: hypothetical protein COB20_06400 [SAR86 cluster bacterium]|uniref:Membrane protein YmcC n=1 Tax=SAR86 cluster bacterium TaxID=2030880 RepID=A0A2A4X7U7_9GAMM|nr:MAG: hypothetical protein COB20_06400 [SAR86 cluster bacterium]